MIADKLAIFYTLLHNKAMPQKYPYLVYTSAGDNANLQHWCTGERHFDLWITYYGTQGQKYKELADYYNTRPGGKFPNLLYIYQHYYDILKKYKAIWVADDDLIINTAAINELFLIREKFNLWLLQPAFDPQGKISHPITQMDSSCYLRYTNFVENTCPLFLRKRLDCFMKFYQPVLVGWGIDWWYLDVLGPNLKGKVAIVDQWPCLNPHDTQKTQGKREIEILQASSLRSALWRQMKEKHRLTSEDRGFVEYGRLVIKLPIKKSYVLSG